MKKLILLTLLLLAQQAWALTVSTLEFVPSSGLRTELGVPVSSLDGLPLTGQSLVVDVAFPGGQFVRLFPEGYPTFIASLYLLVDAPPTGGIGGTISFLDFASNPTVTFPVGPGRTPELLAAAAVFTDPRESIFDIWGLRYSLDLPVEAGFVTEGQLILASVEPFYYGAVPESGGGWLLLGCGLVGLACGGVALRQRD